MITAATIESLDYIVCIKYTLEIHNNNNIFQHTFDLYLRWIEIRSHHLSLEQCFMRIFNVTYIQHNLS